MLKNTVTLLQGSPSKKTSEEPSNRFSPGLQLQDHDVMMRRRVFQCFSQLLKLSPARSIEAIACSDFLPLTIALFSDVEYDASNSLSAEVMAVEWICNISETG